MNQNAKVFVGVAIVAGAGLVVLVGKTLADAHQHELDVNKALMNHSTWSASARATAPAQAVPLSTFQKIEAAYMPCFEAHEKLTKDLLKKCQADAMVFVETKNDLQRSQELFRRFMAPLIQPPTRAEGIGYVELVPSHDRAECMIWGAMWAAQSADDLRDLGFTKIRCPDQKDWAL